MDLFSDDLNIAWSPSCFPSSSQRRLSRNLMRVVKSQLSNHSFAQFESMWGLVDPLLKLLLPFVNHARIASLVHPLRTTRYVYTSKFLILFNFHQSALLKIQFLSGICHCQRFSGDSQITRLGVQIPGGLNFNVHLWRAAYLRLRPDYSVLGSNQLGHH